jgi:aminoglycoside 6'-N-acetyltransferase
MITWRRVVEQDFPLLGRWLAEPRVQRWWCHETSPEAVARDFGPAARGEEPGEDLLVSVDGEPVGLVQRCRLADYPEDLEELAGIVPVPDGAVSLDYLIGDPARLGVGLGPRMIRALVEASWSDYPDAPAIIIPVSAANRASWRALEKAGLVRVAEGEMEPDNPIDDRAHVVYRVDRPAVTLTGFGPADSGTVAGWARTPAEARLWCSRETVVAADVTAWSAAGDVSAYALREAGALVGYGEVWVDDEEREAELARLIVDPDRRGRGLGRTLVRLLLERARLAYPDVFLRVHPANAAALRCYVAAGLRRVPPGAEAAFNAGQPVPYVWLVDAVAIS